MPALLALAKYQNVAVNATGAPGYSAEAYPFPTVPLPIHPGRLSALTGHHATS